MTRDQQLFLCIFIVKIHKMAHVSNNAKPPPQTRAKS